MKMRPIKIEFEPKRFWSKVATGEAGECWEWLAAKDKQGYGHFSICRGQLRKAHRVAWVLTYGPIPEGLLVCHHWDNPSCCNPYHLFLGTSADNVQDAVRKGRVPLGSELWNSKLTKEDVLDIRKWFAEGDWTQQELADAFDVTQQTISGIILRKHWSWLSPSVSKGGYAETGYTGTG